MTVLQWIKGWSVFIGELLFLGVFVYVALGFLP
jgi:hypothetical protein